MELKTLHRIGTFVPLEHRNDPSLQAVRDLVAMALSLAEKPALTPAEISDHITILTEGITLSQPEISGALEKLVADGEVERKPVIAQEVVYKIADGARAKASEELKRFDEILQEVVTILTDRFQSSPHPTVQADSARLVDETLVYIRHVIREHGVFVAKNVYTDARADDLAKTGEAYVDAELDPIEKIAVREAAAYILSGTNPASRAYILNLLQAAVTYSALHLDPTASRLMVREVRLKQLTVLIDTNVIFRLLGLNGKTFQKGVIDTINATKALGCKVRVSDETLAEYRRTFDAQIGSLNADRLPHGADLLDVVAGTLEDFDFRLAFLRERQKHGRYYQPGMFRERFRTINVAGEGIGLLDGVIPKVLRGEDQELTAIWGQYNTWLNAGEKQKPDPAMQHDTRHMLYVRRQQPQRCETLDEANCIFLTCDRSLAKFAIREARSRGARVPTCVLLETWMQYVAPLIPRVGDYEGGFLNFLSVPLVPRSPIDYDQALEIVTRIEATGSPRNEEAIIGMFYGSRALQYAERLSGARLPERQKIIDEAYKAESEKVEAKYQSAIEALRAEIASSTGNLLAEVGARKEVEEQLAATKSNLEVAEDRNITARRESEQIRAMVEGVQKAAQEEKERVSRLEEQLRERDAKLRDQNEATARSTSSYQWVIVALAAIILGGAARLARLEPIPAIGIALLVPIWFLLFEWQSGTRTRTRRIVVASIVTAVTTTVTVLAIIYTDELAKYSGAWSAFQAVFPVSAFVVTLILRGRKPSP